MYSQVPPPDQLCSEAASSAPSPNTAQQDAVDYSKPEHVASHQWKVGSDCTHTLLKVQDLSMELHDIVHFVEFRRNFKSSRPGERKSAVRQLRRGRQPSRTRLLVQVK